MKRILLLILTPIASLIGQNLQISGGNNFSASLCDNKKVYVWGDNLTKIGGPANLAAQYNSAVEVKAEDYWPGLTFKQVDAGSGAHVTAVGCDKYVYVWGGNNCGQHGVGEYTSGGANISGNAPTNCQDITGHGDATIDRVLTGEQNDPSGFLSGAKYVSGGNLSSYAILESNGRVLAWGQNEKGQLGNGLMVNTATPVYVRTSATQFLSNVIQIEGGDECSYALTADGRVWSWGENENSALGRDITGNDPYARPVQVCGAGDLTGIVQISGGDQHALALDANGNIWSWGGDWGPGTVGQGPGYQSGGTANNCARKVVTVNGTNVSPVGPFLGDTDVDGDGTIDKVSYIAAGQASSAAVLSNGMVVTFGGNGFYFNCGNGLTRSAGILGNGSKMIGTIASTCESNDPAQASFAGGVQSPTLVLTSAGNPLKGITSISDGDAWYFATAADGSTYAWGWNQRGELGDGTTANKNFAKKVTLASGCGQIIPCPTKPKLGPDRMVCPLSVNEILNTNTVLSDTSEATWYYKNTLSGALTTWTLLSSTTNTQLANQVGYYIVSVRDKRTYTAVECGACLTVMDTILLSPRTHTYSFTGCWDGVNQKGDFTLTNFPGSLINWYSTATGGSPLNVVPNRKDTLSAPPLTTIAACGAGKYGVYAQDVKSFNAILRPGTTIATAPCGGAGTADNGDKGFLYVEILQQTTISQISFIQGGSDKSNYSFEIYNDDPLAGNCNNICAAPNTNVPKQSATRRYTSSVIEFDNSASGTNILRSIDVNVTLPVGKYWFKVAGNKVVNFSCNPALATQSTMWATPVVDNNPLTDNGVSIHAMQAISGSRNYGNYNGIADVGSGNVFNIKFETGTGYDCDRILVCQTSTCTLPLAYVSFNAIKVGKNVNLSWSTADEDNTKAFAIYRSFDNVNFVKVGEKSAKFNGHSYNDYDYTDHLEVGSGNAYYRIVEIDIFGANSNESNTVSVNLGGYNSSVSIAPNPSAGSFRVSLERESDLIDIKVVDLAGKQIHSQVGTGNSVNVNLGGAHKGVYLIYVFDGTDKWVEKIVVE